MSVSVDQCLLTSCFFAGLRGQGNSENSEHCRCRCLLDLRIRMKPYFCSDLFTRSVVSSKDFTKNIPPHDFSWKLCLWTTNHSYLLLGRSVQYLPETINLHWHHKAEADRISLYRPPKTFSFTLWWQEDPGVMSLELKWSHRLGGLHTKWSLWWFKDAYTSCLECKRQKCGTFYDLPHHDFETNL